MGTAERRQRHRQELRTRIVDAARDILSAHGLGALSIRAIAERIEYSPATIYLYFRDKYDLVREVVRTGFARLTESMERAVAELGPEADPADQLRAAGRAYARFALENAAWFRAMFELPADPRLDRLPPAQADPPPPWLVVLATLIAQARENGSTKARDPARAALIGWAAMHGLVALYLSGRLALAVGGPERLAELVDEALATLWGAWKVERAGEGPRDRGGERGLADA